MRPISGTSSPYLFSLLLSTFVSSYGLTSFGPGLGRATMSLPIIHFFRSPLPCLLETSLVPFNQIPKSGRSGKAELSTHLRKSGLTSCTFCLSEDMTAIVHEGGAPLPNKAIPVDLKSSVAVHCSRAALACSSVNSRRGILIGAVGSTSLSTLLS